MLKHVNTLWDDGLIVCIAGGNHGPKPHSISIPGNSPKIITVGSSDDASPMIGQRSFKVQYSRPWADLILCHEA
ncbi:MAG: hypothetical protein ACLUTO_05780 [Anaerostipes sp.]